MIIQYEGRPVIAAHFSHFIAERNELVFTCVFPSQLYPNTTRVERFPDILNLLLRSFSLCNILQLTVHCELLIKIYFLKVFFRYIFLRSCRNTTGRFLLPGLLQWQKTKC